MILFSRQEAKIFLQTVRFFRLAASVWVKGVNAVPREGECRETVARLMEQYGSRILRLCALRLGDAALAQDAAQETFFRAYRHYEKFRGDASELTWLSRIAVNCCRDMLRSPWHRHVNRRIDADALPEQAEAFSFPDDTVIQAVLGLNAKYREAVLLRYYQGLKLRETAAALGLRGAGRGRGNQVVRRQLPS